MRIRLLLVAAFVLLASGGALAETFVHPHIALEGGISASVLPAFDTEIFFSYSYADADVEAYTRTTAAVLPGFLLLQEFGLSFSPEDVRIGIDGGLGVIPFGLNALNGWAEVSLFEDYMGSTDILLEAATGGEVWLAGLAGGEAYVDLEGIIDGESMSTTLRSRTSVFYAQYAGLGLEEELGVRFSFERPNFFAGQLLAEDDLSSLTLWVSARLRLDAGGFSVPGVVCGVEVRVERPVSDEE